jgi:hypothetical protein
MTNNENPQTEAERTAVTQPTVVSGHGYPANRDEVSPSPTGWLASGPTATNPGSLGTLEEVSRETSR